MKEDWSSVELTALEPGQLVSREYLANGTFCSGKTGPYKTAYKRALEVMLVGMIQGKKFSDSEIASRIEQCGWKQEDSYVCIRLDAEEQEKSGFQQYFGAVDACL